MAAENNRDVDRVPESHPKELMESLCLNWSSISHTQRGIDGQRGASIAETNGSSQLTFQPRGQFFVTPADPVSLSLAWFLTITGMASHSLAIHSLAKPLLTY